MRKYLFGTCLSVCFSFYSNAQDLNDQIVRRIIDSSKNELKNAKGNKRIDCLNLLAESYYWIWDENDKHLDTACMYSEEAYRLAKNSGYKQGLGYSLLWKSHCYGGRVDRNINNNNSEVNYIETYNYANKAIQIGEEIKDYKLVGDVYNTLKWLERWKSDWTGDRLKYKNNLEKAIYYYEKPVTKKLTGHLGISKCDQCQGNEGELGSLYLQLGDFQAGGSAVRQSIFEKAIFYYKKSSSTSGLASAYTSIALTLTQSGNIESSIAYLNKALELYEKDRDEYGVASTYTNICSALFRQGDFEKGIEYSKKNIALAEKIARHKPNEKNFYLYNAYYWMGRFYEIADDMETAFAYLRKAQFYAPNNPQLWNSLTAIAELHRSIGNYDSSMHYLSFTLNNEIGIGKRILTALYISLKQYDKALELIKKHIATAGEGNDIFNLSRTYINAGKAYYGKNDFTNALANAREGMVLVKKIGHNYILIDNYRLLSDIYFKMGNSDSSYYYLKQYTILKDSLLKKQLYIKLNDYKKEAEEAKRIGQINLLQKDNLIKEQELQKQVLLQEQNEAQLTLLDKDNELKDQKLKEQTLLKEQNQSQLTLLDKENKLKDQRLKQQAFIRNALLGGLLLFILLGVFVFRIFSLKRKNEKLSIKKEQAELQQKVAELEMQALRAQMNPHFIFNCLNSINRFIFKNETNAASDYLTRFSRLIRMVLLHSQKKLVPLEDELEMLKLYLDMERLRFKNAFDYHITTTNAIENSSVFIPPLLLQPFCENAIWHGLMHKDGHGHLNIELNETNGVLHCAITDDGVGREKAEEFKSKSAEKEKSMGLKITKERLSLLNQGATGGTFYEIEDLRNEHGEIVGTKVNLQIKYKQSVEEYA